MVKNIEELRAELHIQTFGNHRVLVDGQVPLFVSWSRKRVAPKITEVASTGNAVVGGAGYCARLRKGCHRGWNCKRSQSHQNSKAWLLINNPTPTLQP